MPSHSALTALLLVPALLLGGAGAVHAKGDQDLGLSLNATIVHDSNLFRLPDSASVQALTGHTSAADTVAITSLGMSYKKSYSLQRFEADFTLVNYRYQNFSHLDFTASNYNAAWLWSLTPRWQGTFSSSRQETLNSFSDYQNYTQPNQRTLTTQRFDTEFQVGGGWRALGGIAHSAQTNQQTLVAEGDFTTNSLDLGLRYAFTSGSSITYRINNNSGHYLNRALPSSGAYDDSYTQLDHELRLRWLLDGKTTANLSAIHQSRSHPNYPQRDYSGLNLGAGLVWGISAKTSLSTNATRELSSYQTSNANYSQTDRLTLAPAWHVSPKALLRLSFAAARRDFLGTPGPAASGQRSDTLRDTSLSLDWQPYQFFTVSAALQNARRDSSLPGLDYNSNQATISAQYTY